MSTLATPRPGTYLESTTTRNRYVTVVETPQYLRPVPGMFVVEWANTGQMAFAMLTGNDRGYDRWCKRPTAVLFAIDTVADFGRDDDGEPVMALWGDPGEKRPLGTWFVMDRECSLNAREVTL